MWPAVQCGFDLVRGVAHELGNEGELSGKGVRRRFKSALEKIRAAARQATKGSKLKKEGTGPLREGVGQL